MDSASRLTVVDKALRSQALFACFWKFFLCFLPGLRRLENQPAAIATALTSRRPSDWTTTAVVVPVPRTSSRASTDLPVKIILDSNVRIANCPRQLNPKQLHAPTHYALTVLAADKQVSSRALHPARSPQTPPSRSGSIVRFRKRKFARGTKVVVVEQRPAQQRRRQRRARAHFSRYLLRLTSDDDDFTRPYSGSFPGDP